MIWLAAMSVSFVGMVQRCVARKTNQRRDQQTGVQVLYVVPKEGTGIGWT